MLRDAYKIFYKVLDDDFVEGFTTYEKPLFIARVRALQEDNKVFEMRLHYIDVNGYWSDITEDVLKEIDEVLF